MEARIPALLRARRSCLRPALVALLGLAPVAACGAGSQRVELAPQALVSPRQQVQVWSTGQVTLLHGVRTTDDSLLGISWLTPLDSDTATPVAISRSAIDSVRFVNRPQTAILGLLAVGLFGGLTLCLLTGCGMGT